MSEASLLPFLIFFFYKFFVFGGMDVYGSSCNLIFFGLILSFFYFFALYPVLMETLKESAEAKKRDNYMNCRTQK